MSPVDLDTHRVTCHLDRLLADRDFDECRVADRLASGLGVDNEEEELPVAVCTGPTRSWADLWPTLRHLG